MFEAGEGVEFGRHINCKGAYMEPDSEVCGFRRYQKSGAQEYFFPASNSSPDFTFAS